MTLKPIGVRSPEDQKFINLSKRTNVNSIPTTTDWGLIYAIPRRWKTPGNLKGNDSKNTFAIPCFVPPSVSH